MKTLTQKMKELPAGRRRSIEKKARAIIAEVDSLAALRGAASVSQERLADALGVSQPVVSRIERQSDLLLSTLQDYIGALGGRLNLVVEFPGRKPTRLRSFSEAAASYRATGRSRRKQS
jgi:transcriptional regulator with XRE-family HTH domain